MHPALVTPSLSHMLGASWTGIPALSSLNALPCFGKAVSSFLKKKLHNMNQGEILLICFKIHL